MSREPPPPGANNLFGFGNVAVGPGLSTVQVRQPFFVLSENLLVPTDSFCFNFIGFLFICLDPILPFTADNLRRHGLADER